MTFGPWFTVIRLTIDSIINIFQSGFFSSTSIKSNANGEIRRNENPSGSVKISFSEDNFKAFEIDGYQFGEKFGHSLCAVDIDGDGFDDLVVGAPFHARNEQVILTESMKTR